MATDPVTGFASGLERSQAALDAGGIPSDDPSILDTRLPHAVGGVGSADTYGLAGVGEAKRPLHDPLHAAALNSVLDVPLGTAPPHAALPGHEAHATGAASFVGQSTCNCVKNGKCTCKGTCSCDNCVGEHTEAQLKGKGQPEHPRPAVTGI